MGRKVNVFEYYAVEKYGDAGSFPVGTGVFGGSTGDIIYESDDFGDSVNSADFTEPIQMGIKLCGGLKIDFIELFGNGSICGLRLAYNFKMDKEAEDKYSLLAFQSRNKILDYIDGILEK